MKKLILIGCIFALTGCSDFYDNVATPVYKGVKVGVESSDINPKTKDRLKKLSEKIEKVDEVRTVIKDSK